MGETNIAGIFWDFEILFEKNPTPGDFFFGILTLGFFGRKNPKSPGFGNEDPEKMLP